jgi:hypothetical protein
MEMPEGSELAELRKLCNHRPFEWTTVNGKRAAVCICGTVMLVPYLNEICRDCGAYRSDGCACKYDPPPDRIWTEEELRADAETQNSNRGY